MAAPMHKITFQYKKVMFTLALEESIVTKLKTDADYIKELITFLIEQGTLKDKGVPTDADLADIKVVDEGVIPMFIPEEPTVTVNTSSSNTSQANLDKGLNGEKIVWGDTMTRLVITARLDRDAEFDKPIPKRKLWSEIADVMQEHGYDVTSDDCDIKWRNLLVTYRKNKDKAMKHGEEACNWKFFSLMHKVLSKKELITPLASKLLSIKRRTSKRNTESDDSMSSATSETFCRVHPTNRLHPRSVSSSRSSKSASIAPSQVQTPDSQFQRALNRIYKFQRKRFNKDSAASEIPVIDDTPAWFANYLKDKKIEDEMRERKEEERWREHAELEEKKIAAIYALIDVIKAKQ